MKRFWLLLVLTSNLLPAQKRVEKSIVNPNVAAISIDVSKVFELAIATAEGNDLTLEATIDGEYRNDLLLNVREEGNSLLISTDFQPNFQLPNDKLGAHKVISIGLKVVLPEQKEVSIFGTGCNVTARGNYRNLNIVLSNGRCRLDHVSETASVSTLSGAITVAVKSAQIQAKSKYGEVYGDRIPSGDRRYNLSSVTGDILLNKTE